MEKCENVSSCITITLSRPKFSIAEASIAEVDFELVEQPPYLQDIAFSYY